MDHKKLLELEKCDPHSMHIFEGSLVDTFYPQRPVEMENVCLYDFVKSFEKCGVGKDGAPQYRKLSKPTLPNHKLFDPNKETERDKYYYSLLLPFLPFRDEHTLLSENETVEEAFEHHLRVNNQLNTHHEKLQQMLQAQAVIKEINEARQQEPEVPTAEEEQGPQILAEA